MMLQLARPSQIAAVDREILVALAASLERARQHLSNPAVTYRAATDAAIDLADWSLALAPFAKSARSSVAVCALGCTVFAATGLAEVIHGWHDGDRLGLPLPRRTGAAEALRLEVIEALGLTLALASAWLEDLP